MNASIQTEARELFASAKTHDDRAVLLQAISDGFHQFKKREIKSLVSRAHVTFSAYTAHLSAAYVFGTTLHSPEDYAVVVAIASESLKRRGVNADHE